MIRIVQNTDAIDEAIASLVAEHSSAPTHAGDDHAFARAHLNSIILGARVADGGALSDNAAISAASALLRDHPEPTKRAAPRELTVVIVRDNGRAEPEFTLDVED